MVLRLLGRGDLVVGREGILQSICPHGQILKGRVDGRPSL
jgi:hypothetical protein